MCTNLHVMNENRVSNMTRMDTEEVTGAKTQRDTHTHTQTHTRPLSLTLSRPRMRKPALRAQANRLTRLERMEIDLQDLLQTQYLSPHAPHNTRIPPRVSSTTMASVSTRGRRPHTPPPRVSAPTRTPSSPPLPPGSIWMCTGLSTAGPFATSTLEPSPRECTEVG